MNQLTLRQPSERNWLLPGEKIQIEETNIGYISPIRKIGGRVLVTNFRLRFEAWDNSVKRSKCCQFDVPLGCISRVEKVGYSTVSLGEDSYGLEITCKDLRNIRFVHQPTNHSRRPLYENLQKFAFPVTNKLPFFATLYKEEFAFNGWSLFDTQKEFKRMNVPNETWGITKINDRYDLADTYPAYLAVPAAALNEGEEFLYKVGEFRSKQRIPVLSWINPVTQASLTRSSQPMVGVTSRKSAEDERYLRMIVEANAHAHQLLIFDARPAVNAKVNKAKGGGFEHSYDNCRLIFLDIQNIHAVRESLRKLKDASFPRVDEKNWLRALDETKWLNHIQTILDGSKQIAREVEDNHASVLVHCSDGWDRTAQLTSLAMLQLDPFYRTINGFAILIEKEWCSFGHKFAQRVGHGEDRHNDSERSPIFVQFIDCVWQLLRQFPYGFEFNSSLLITILDELYACRFGTFLYNTEKQRHREQEVRKKTISLWSYIIDNKRRFLNPLYNRYPRYIDVLRPNTKMAQIQTWKEYYFRHNPRVVAQDRIDIEPLLNEKFLMRLEALTTMIEEREQAVNKGASPAMDKSTPPAAMSIRRMDKPLEFETALEVEPNTSASGAGFLEKLKDGLCIIVIGMAGSGKSSFVQRLVSYLHQKKTIPYVLNLDPAVNKVSYPVNIDIRDTVKYKEIMKEYNLGPNGAIMTCLNLFCTQFHQVLDLMAKRVDTCPYFIIDTPGQIEAFTWSASGSIITDLLASSRPAMIAYIIDSVRAANPTTFMSNMLYACSILYRTKLPFIIVLNKADIVKPTFIKRWMEDFENFQEALDENRSTFMNDLTRSLSLVLDEFYEKFSSVAVSSLTGEGIEEFIHLTTKCIEEYNSVYLSMIKKLQKERMEQMEQMNAEKVANLSVKENEVLSTTISELPTAPVFQKIHIGGVEQEDAEDADIMR